MKKILQFNKEAPPATHRPMHDVAHEFDGSLFERLLHRLQEDFTLAMVSLFAVVAVTLISPFAVFRVLEGNWMIALLDAGIVVAIIRRPGTGGTRRDHRQIHPRHGSELPARR